jgi:hypothetical protein
LDGDVPVSYQAHDSMLLTLSEAMAEPPDIVLDLTPGALATGTLSATVTPGSLEGRVNDVYLRWADNAIMPLAEDGDASNTPSYPVPTLAGATLMLAAEEGDWSWQPYAVAYADQLSAGAADVTLEIPPPATLISPTLGATDVTTDTPFTFSGGEHVHVIQIASNPNFDAMFVVTTAQEVRIPVMDGTGYTINCVRAEGYEPWPCYWYVEAHGGQYATVDDAISADGFLSSYAFGYPRGPRQGSGQFTMSDDWGFETPSD